jgi:hypothetical protein
MGGEVGSGLFDVTKLEVIELETAGGAEVSSNIIDVGENFYLKATFEGSGAIWSNVLLGKYVAQFYAHGMGYNVPNQDLGTTSGDVNALGGPPYTVKSPTKSITDEGLYRCGVTITFQTSTGVPFYGVLGYNEDCVMQVNELEE